MKLLLENWRKYVLENKQEEKYFPWVKLLQDIDFSPPIKETTSLLAERGFKRVGSGMFRVVFIPDNGNANVVVKVSKSPYSNHMNEKEYIANREFPLLFPKTFAHSDDWAWIAMERVTVIERGMDSELELALKTSMPNMYKFAQEMESPANMPGQPPILARHILSFIMVGAREGKPEARRNQHHYSDVNLFGMSPESVQEMFNYGLKNSHYFRQLVKAVNRLNVDTGDLREGNIGINENNELKIIDASIFTR